MQGGGACHLVCKETPWELLIWWLEPLLALPPPLSVIHASQSSGPHPHPFPGAPSSSSEALAPSACPCLGHFPFLLRAPIAPRQALMDGSHRFVARGRNKPLRAPFRAGDVRV